MSMRLRTLLLSLLTALLMACGGGDPLTDTEEDPVDPNTPPTVEEEVGNPQIGVGSGEAFVDDQLSIVVSSLSAGGSTQISATIVDAANGNTQVTTAEYFVTFTSTCASTEQAEFSKENDFISTGAVSVTYTAAGCSGTDQITFTLYESANGVADTTQILATAIGTLVVAPPQIGAINYVGADTSAISISTIGNPVLPKLAVLTFRIIDTNNNPVANRTVSFELTSTKGGIELALTEGVTNEAGEVEAVVLAGTAHTTTSVVASTLATNGVAVISTSSQPISVTTGIPDQDSFEIVAEVLNPGSYDLSGVTVEVTAFVGDQFQNPVADGTIVNFTAESGLIDSSCTTEAGTCSVNWVSSGYRPGQENEPDYDGLDRVNECNTDATDDFGDEYDCPDGTPGHTAFGLTTILAYTEGEAGYNDSNNNGVFDIGESFEAFAEAIRDDDQMNFELINDTVDLDENENGPVEFFADYNSNDERDAAPSLYQGSLCSQAAKDEGHCGSLMHIRDSVVLSQSRVSSEPFNMRFFLRSGDNFTPFDGDLDFNDDDLANDSGTFWVLLTDGNDSVAATETRFSSGGDGYEVSGDTGEVPNSIGLLPEEYTGLPSSFGTLFSVSFAVDDEPKDVTVTATLDDANLSYRFVCVGCP